MRYRLCTLAFLATVSMAGAEPLDLPGILVEEAELDRTLVSKPGWLRGLHFKGSALPDNQRPRMIAVLPEAWAGATACARITSKGGSYSALVEFEIPQELPEERSATFGFPLQSNLIKVLTPENGGISLEKGACVGDTADGEVRQYVANLWNEAAPAPAPGGTITLTMHLNIARADEIVPTAELGDEAADVACRKLDEPDALAFNYSCTVSIPAEKLAADAELLFRYTRLYRGRASDERRAVIFVGAGE